MSKTSKTQETPKANNKSDVDGTTMNNLITEVNAAAEDDTVEPMII